MLYSPATAYMFEWWRARRGLSSGIMFAGTGAGGLIMPILCAALLDRFGRRTTLVSIVSPSVRKLIGYRICRPHRSPTAQHSTSPASHTTNSPTVVVSVIAHILASLGRSHLSGLGCIHARNLSAR
jgi:MFS family permease